MRLEELFSTLVWCSKPQDYIDDEFMSSMTNNFVSYQWFLDYSLIISNDQWLITDHQTDEFWLKWWIALSNG